MNRENFEKLPEEKKKVIEKAYFAAYSKEITPGDFFAVCKQSLTHEEYAGLFTDSAAKEKPQEEIKTEYIEDIMQYTGVDLKEEADNIVKDAEYNVSPSTANEIDSDERISSLFDTKLFYEFVNRVCYSRGVKISDDGINFLFRVIRRKLLDLIDRMDEASKIRTSADLSNYGFKIDNETSKQLWYLNELERTRLDKLMLKKDEDVKKKKIMQEREDLLIKKRQSNSVAMAAMGLKQKSWMTPDESKDETENKKFSSIYAPFDEKAFEEKIKERRITMKDYVYVLERDKRYNKSIILIQHYFR